MGQQDDEDFLGRVLGVLGMAQHPKGQLVNLVVDCGEKLLGRRSITQGCGPRTTFQVCRADGNPLETRVDENVTG